MTPKRLFSAVAVLLLMTGSGAANSVKESGVITCVTDKWNESEPEKGRKLAEYAGRCAFVPSDPAAPKATEDCVGLWESMADGGWKGAGTCIHTYKGGDKWFLKWEQVKEDGSITITGGTGKFDGVKGGGTFKLEALTDTMVGGTYTQKLELP